MCSLITKAEFFIFFAEGISKVLIKTYNSSEEWWTWNCKAHVHHRLKENKYFISFLWKQQQENIRLFQETVGLDPGSQPCWVMYRCLSQGLWKINLCKSAPPPPGCQAFPDSNTCSTFKRQLCRSCLVRLGWHPVGMGEGQGHRGAIRRWHDFTGREDTEVMSCLSRSHRKLYGKTTKEWW